MSSCVLDELFASTLDPLVFDLHRGLSQVVRVPLSLRVLSSAALVLSTGLLRVMARAPAHGVKTPLRPPWACTPEAFCRPNAAATFSASAGTANANIAGKRCIVCILPLRSEQHVSSTFASAHKAEADSQTNPRDSYAAPRFAPAPAEHSYTIPASTPCQSLGLGITLSKRTPCHPDKRTGAGTAVQETSCPGKRHRPHEACRVLTHTNSAGTCFRQGWSWNGAVTCKNTLNDRVLCERGLCEHVSRWKEMTQQACSRIIRNRRPSPPNKTPASPGLHANFSAPLALQVIGQSTVKN